MIYHYTTLASAASIRRESLLRAYPVIVYQDLSCRERVELAPAVWFTTDADLDGPVAVKAALGGITPDQSRAFWRFAVVDTLPDLPTWAHTHDYPPELFRWMILTGKLAGSEYTDWRLAGGDVPRSAWAAIEYLEAGRWVPAREE